MFSVFDEHNIPFDKTFRSIQPTNISLILGNMQDSNNKYFNF